MGLLRFDVFLYGFFETLVEFDQVFPLIVNDLGDSKDVSNIEFIVFVINCVAFVAFCELVAWNGNPFLSAFSVVK